MRSFCKITYCKFNKNSVCYNEDIIGNDIITKECTLFVKKTSNEVKEETESKSNSCGNGWN